MLRVYALLIAGVLLGLAQDVVKADPAQEALLKERVGKFWDAFVSGKYRLADEYVSDEAKDAFYVWPKKKVKSYKIQQIFYVESGKAAKVVSVVNVNMAMMGVGSMDVDQPVETWWRKEDGGWFWFVPKNEKRQTPFGTMESNAASGEAALVPQGQMIKAPDIATLKGMVKPDRTEVHFQQGVAQKETVEFKNALPGVVSLTIDVPPSDEIDFQLAPKMVPRDGAGKLVVSYQPKAKAGAEAGQVTKVVRVGVAQTGMIYAIKVVIDPK